MKRCKFIGGELVCAAVVAVLVAFDVRAETGGLSDFFSVYDVRRQRI